jgi:hypothetical protein
MAQATLSLAFAENESSLDNEAADAWAYLDINVTPTFLPSSSMQGTLWNTEYS